MKTLFTILLILLTSVGYSQPDSLELIFGDGDTTFRDYVDFTDCCMIFDGDTVVNNPEFLEWFGGLMIQRDSLVYAKDSMLQVVAGWWLDLYEINQGLLDNERAYKYSIKKLEEDVRRLNSSPANRKNN